ncbi:MAG: hypothetical protein R2874_01620 [Desulfobacterales bacterium]
MEKLSIRTKQADIKLTSAKNQPLKRRKEDFSPTPTRLTLDLLVLSLSKGCKTINE